MREITNEFLEKVKEEYLGKDIYTVARRALSSCQICHITRVSEQSEFIKNRFSVNIKTLPATNQKSSGRCWIFAGLNVLREKIAKKYNLTDFELSQNYVAFYDKLEKSNFLLEKIIELRYQDKFDRTIDYLLSNGIEDGGQWDMFVNVVKKYGVVPQDAYPETFQSSNTRQIDTLLNKYIRKFAFNIRGIKDDIEGINYRKQEMVKNIYKMLCSAFGVPPTKFSFEYEDADGNYNLIKDITPHQFLNDYVEANLDDYVSIINAPTRDKPFYTTYTVEYLGNVIEGAEIRYLNEEMGRLKDLIIAQLKDGEPVWFGSDCRKEGDRQEGIWDDDSFDVDRLFQIDSEMSKEAMLDTRESAMNHAMVITGVNLVDDKPTKWKIENSWGDKQANKGYYVATDSWFDKYVFQAVINKKYLSDLEKQDLEKDPIRLNPWDPMGTLA